MSPDPTPTHVAFARVTRRERFVACALTAVVLVVALFTPALARVVPPFLHPETLDATIAAVVACCLVVSTAILRDHYRATETATFAVIGAAFGVTALLSSAYALVLAGAIPGAGPSSQLATRLWLAIHGGFVALVGGYVWARLPSARGDAPMRRAFVRRYTRVCAAIGVGTLACLVATRDLRVAGDAHLALDGALAIAAGCVVTALALATRLRESTHLWLGVVLVATLVESVAADEVAPPAASLAWYAVRAIGVVAAVVFLAIQLRQIRKLLAVYATRTHDLEVETIRDPLTRLLNRRGFDERFAAEVDECVRAGEPFALLILDVDHFKLYNDHFGHAAGDAALRLVAVTLGQTARGPREHLARVGGEEFALLLPAADASEAMSTAERIREAILRRALPAAPGSTHAILTLSIGLIAVDGGALATTTTLRLYEAADAALYRAKASGRNRICRATSLSLPQRLAS